MKLRISSGPALLAASIAGFVVSLVILIHVIPEGTVASFSLPVVSAATLPRPQKINSDLPTRLKIPRIKVDAIVEHVGLTTDGSMAVPKGAANVAWFELGQRPGEIGTAVIDGHYGRKNGKASVFDNLYKLRIGDKILVEDGHGITNTFVVRASKKFDPKADASEIFVSDDNKSHLNIVTCDGVWNKLTRGYPKRLVIFADKE